VFTLYFYFHENYKNLRFFPKTLLCYSLFFGRVSAVMLSFRLLFSFHFILYVALILNDLEILKSL